VRVDSPSPDNGPWQTLGDSHGVCNGDEGNPSSRASFSMNSRRHMSIFQNNVHYSSMPTP
ncbi:hypothetical protein STEG23_029439, partial [Scotinomys teguina]